MESNRKNYEQNWNGHVFEVSEHILLCFFLQLSNLSSLIEAKNKGFIQFYSIIMLPFYK